ncbi:CRISPR-associated helicase Cas3' [Myxococcota bacterium]|nr:CRISPR-associated helicase Cas3' [Myxococcota bacterium]
MSQRFSYPRLLAKSSLTPDVPHEKETLVGHTRDVVLSAKAIAEIVGEKAVVGLGLPKHFIEKLSEVLPLSAAIHDLGKANHQFQRMVRQKQGERNLQAFRHEKISVYLLGRFPSLYEWFFEDKEPLYRYAVIFSVLGHHLKTEDTTFRTREGTGDDRVDVLVEHPDFRRCLELCANELGLGSLPSFGASGATCSIDLLDAKPLNDASKIAKEFESWWGEEANEDQRLFVALCKALLMASDVAGSILGLQRKEAGAWVHEALLYVCEEGMLGEAAKKRLGGFPVRPFQKTIASCAVESGDVVFVRAGCGSGKTAGAYLWAERHAVGRQLFFAYPTTGTATQGFADYVLPSDFSDLALLSHGRREVDLEALYDTNDRDLGDRDDLHRVEALEVWYHPWIVCTVDQVLGLVQNQRRPLYASPALMRGAFVFDEIHLYDQRLFGALLRFLEAFRGAPILLMTASLSAHRLGSIRDLLQKQGRHLHQIEGPKEREELARYTIGPIVLKEPWEQVEQAILSGQKVLWVSNTVSRCTEIAKEAAKKFPPEIVLPYHSRYRYVDRVERHQRVIEAFKKEGPVLACTTQVCEVSLDISADLLISDIAPASALIQRMGRLNRRSEPERPLGTRHAVFVEVEKTLPYDAEELDHARRWIQELLKKGGEISQDDLRRAFESCELPSEFVAQVQSEWLDHGGRAQRAPLREAGHTISILREEDFLQHVQNKKGKEKTKAIIAHTIPMPFWEIVEEYRTWPREGSALISPKDRVDYDNQWGATWQKQEQSKKQNKPTKKQSKPARSPSN